MTYDCSFPSSTRALFLEATLYTIPTNLHTTVRILVEFPVTGRPRATSRYSFMLFLLCVTKVLSLGNIDE